MLIIKLSEKHTFELNFWGELFLSLAVTMTGRYVIFVILDSVIFSLLGLLLLLLWSINGYRWLWYQIKLISYKRKRFKSIKEDDWEPAYPLHPGPEKPKLLGLSKFGLSNYWRTTFWQKSGNFIILISSIRGLVWVRTTSPLSGFVIQLPYETVIVFYRYRRLLCFFAGSFIVLLFVSGMEKYYKKHMFRLEMLLGSWVVFIYLLLSSHNGSHHGMIQRMTFENAVTVCRKIRYPRKTYGMPHQIYQWYLGIDQRTNADFDDKDVLIIGTPSRELVVKTPQRTIGTGVVVPRPSVMPSGKLRPILQLAPPVKEMTDGMLQASIVPYWQGRGYQELDILKYTEKALKNKQKFQNFANFVKERFGKSYIEGNYKSFPKPKPINKFKPETTSRNTSTSLAKKYREKQLQKERERSIIQRRRREEDISMHYYWERLRERSLVSSDVSFDSSKFEKPMKVRDESESSKNE